MTLKDHSLSSNVANAAATVSKVDQILALAAQLDEKDLLQVRQQLDGMLVLDLEGLDLNAELSLQYRQAKLLLAEVQGDKETPANQKSQIFNAVRAQLGDIVKQQESVWSMERLKKFEVAFVKAAHLLTDESKAAFFDLYTHLVRDEVEGATTAAAPAEPRRMGK